MSRDDKASYYDLELPDGTRTEVWSVLRAVFTAEEALGYAKGCLLTRIMRDGHKDVDRQREAEKVAVEAGMLREAMEAYLATPRAIAVTVSCDDPAARIAELERERDGWRQTAERAQPDLDAMRKTLEAERQAAVATAEELERVRKESGAQAQRAADAESAFRRERTRADALHAELRGEREAHEATRREMDRVVSEVTGLRKVLDRYRHRRQSKEPAPHKERVLLWHGGDLRWVDEPGYAITHPSEIWTHQPPAPEGE